MKTFTRAFVMLLVLAGIGIVAYSWLNSNPRATQAPPAPLTTTLQPSPSPAIHFPVPTETSAAEPDASGAPKAPLPPVDQSDSTIESVLEKLFGKKHFEALFNIDSFVRRVVVTFENASKNKQIPAEFSVFKTFESSFRVIGKDDAVTIDPSNAKRYSPYVDLIQAVDARKIVSAYIHFYPLFQAAYQDLGTQEYFNDRVIQVIDSLLQTPDVLDPIRVVPSGAGHTYKYADDRLETLSSAQKALIRMGDTNNQAVKAKLRQIRAQLVHLDK